MDKVLLEDVCYILDNKRVPITECDRKKGPYPYYGANGVQDYVDDYIFDDELVLLAEDGGNFGSKEKPIAYRVSGKCWVNNHAHVLKPKENIDVNYLCYSLMFYDVSGFVNGATRQKLTQSNMRQMLIPFCSLTEQKRIADELDKVSGLIEKRQKQLEKLDLLIKSRFVEMFQGGSKNIIQLQSICEICSSKRIFEKEYVEDGVPFYRTKEIVELSCGKEISTELFIGYEKYNEIKKNYSVPMKNDLLITAIGTIGVIWIVNDESEFYFKDGNIIWIKASKKFNSIFMKELLVDEIKNYKNKIVAGTAYMALTIAGLKNLEINLPPIELQNQFADFVEKVEQNKSKIKNSLDKLITLKKALMQKYFG